MDSELIIPASIRDARTPGFAAAIDRLGNIEISPLLVYLVNEVQASALPHLAEQFNVYGRSSWRLASTEADKRNLIKRAIELHRFKGTPWALKEAILALGFDEVDLEEGGPEVPNWYDFRLFVRGRDITPGDIELVKGVVAEFSPARSRLYALAYGRIDYWADDGTWGDDNVWSGYQQYELY